MIKTAIIWASTLALAAVSSANTFTYSDSVFPDSNWTTSILSQTGLGSFTSSQQLTGGNPDEFRQTTHLQFTQTLTVGHLNNTFVFSPAANGRLDTVAASYDYMVTSPGVGQSWYLLANQNDTYYSASPFFNVGGNQGWTHYDIGATSAASFTRLFGNGPTQLDLDGSPITFGYWSGNTTLDTPVDTIGGVDNLMIVVTSIVPEPAGLSGMIALSLSMLRRRWF